MQACLGSPETFVGCIMKGACVTLPCVGFGLGKLHHVFSAAQRERIVLGAFDAGLTHFDLAAAYGDGLCEAEAGRILRGRRSTVSLATKFGIPCRSLGGRSTLFYFAGKALRKGFSRSYGSEYALRNFSPAAAVHALEQSLKRLRTDYVDYFFFHEPRDSQDFGVVLQAVEAMERLKQKGKILHYGISASTEQFLVFGREDAIGDTVQFELASQSPSLVAMLPTNCRTSAFGLMRFLTSHDRARRLDYGEVLRWFFDHYPATMPILATNRPDEIARLGRALTDLSTEFAATPGASPLRRRSDAPDASRAPER
jgi:hypothetical protein